MLNIDRINNLFKRLAQFVVSRRAAIILLYLFILAFSLAGIRRTHFENTFDRYFVDGDPMIKMSEEFGSVFGNEHYVAVLVSSKEGIFTKKNLELVRELSNELTDSISYADNLTSVTEMTIPVGNKEGICIDKIVPDPVPADPAELAEIKKIALSKKSVCGKLVSKDGKSAWIVLKLRPFPSSDKEITDKRLTPKTLTGKETIKIVSKAKYADINPQASGLPYLFYHEDKYLSDSVQRLLIVAFIVALLITAIVTRSLKGTLLPIITSLSCLLVAFGIIGWLGLYIDRIVFMMIVSLILAISIAYYIHIYNLFVCRFRLHGKRKLAVTESLSETGWPVLFSGITTLAAMLTFLTMKILPMRAIGVDSAICILVSLFSSLVLVPLFLSFGKDRKPDADYSNEFEIKAGDKFSKFGAWVLRYHKSILFSSIVVTIVCGTGIFRIEPSCDFERTMGRNVDYVRHFLDIGETELGSCYSYDVMISLPGDGDAKLPQNLKNLELLEKRCDGYSLTKRHTSVLDIIKEMNCTINGDSSSYYSIPPDANAIAQLLLLYEEAGGSNLDSWIDYDCKRLRLQIEIKNYNSHESEFELKDIRSYAEKLFPGAAVSAVGSLPKTIKVQQYISTGQIKSMLASVLIIGILLMIVFGNWRLGLIGMIPNLAPVIIAGGIMGWMNYPLDPVTACALPMILGIAVDDTIHFINHGHEEFNRTGSYVQSVKNTFRISGVSIVMSTVIITTILLSTVSVEAKMMRNFGIVSSVGMISALLADLFITPVLFRYLNVFGKEKIKK